MKKFTFSFLVRLTLIMAIVFKGFSSMATTCPNATVITQTGLPIVNQALTCGTVNDINSATIAASILTGGCAGTLYYGGQEALYVFTPTVTGLYDVSMIGQTWTGIFIFNGCPTTAGSTCMGGVSNSSSAKNLSATLTAGVTYYIMFDTWPTPFSPCPGTFSMNLLLPNTATAVAAGGLWSSTATWANGAVPNAASTVIIPAGTTVVVDQVVGIVDLTVSGNLQWNGTTNALSTTGNILINPGGKFLPYTTTAGAAFNATINVVGNFENNGYCNFSGGFSVAGLLNFNGAGSTLSGTGVFEGNGTSGIMRQVFFQNTGSNTINTSQNLNVYSFGFTAGSINTNNKLIINNTASILGQPFNTQVASVSVTAMGTLYNAAPVVFGATVSPWASAGLATANTRYFDGNNVYLCTGGGSFGATAPSGTAPTTQLNGTATLLYIGSLGTLGNPFQVTAVTVGTQYFYGGNHYTCTVAGIPSATAPPTHTSGTAASGAATFLYAGTPAQVTVNYDATTQTARSLNLTSAGSGYSSSLAPSIVFNVGILGGTGSGAAATAVVPYAITGPTASLTQKSGVASVTGGITINGDQGVSALSSDPQSSTGVGTIFTTNGGVNYTVAPTVGFTGPTALNLVTSQGSGYTAAPTLTVTGGTLVTGTALSAANFTVTVNQGKVVSVYLNTTSATYSVPPTISISGNATIAWPVNCWPAATANIGANRQVSDFTITNSGYGYVTAPTVAVGTVSGTTAGGTFTTVATAPFARVGAYNLTLNFFAPSPAPPVAQIDDAFIPASRKINTLSLAGNGNGLSLNSNLTLFGTFPLGLTASGNVPGNILNLNGNNLICSWQGYAGAISTFGVTNAYLTNGSMSVYGRGGGTTGSNYNFPFSGYPSIFTGNGVGFIDGSDITNLTVTQTAAPSSVVIGGNAAALGNRAFRVQAKTFQTTNGISGNNPTATLRYNSQDGLTTTQDQTFIAQGPSLTGAWNLRSLALGVGGPLAATGTLTTATSATIPVTTPVTYTGDNYLAWAGSSATIDTAGVSPTTLCANSGFFTITGTNLLGVSAVFIGGTPVANFTVVSSTQITATSGIGTNGVVSIVKNGQTVVGTQIITLNASPAAPTALPANNTVLLGSTAVYTATGTGGTLNWYNQPFGGAILGSGTSFTTPPNCASGSYYVAENNGSCDGPRFQVSITVSPFTIASSNASFCGSLGSTSALTLTATPNDPSISYGWTANVTTAVITNNSLPVANATITETSDFYMTATANGCSATAAPISIGVYNFPAITPTAVPSTICGGTSATLATGLSASNFAAICITPAAIPAPTQNFTNLALNGIAQIPLQSGSLDDGGWGGIPIGFNFNFFGTTYTTINVGTNGVLQFGAYNGSFTGGLGDYIIGALPNTVDPLAAIYGCANDLHCGYTGANVKYWTAGVAPNRKFIVDYQVFTYGAPSSNNNFQIILYETLGQVDIVASIISSTQSKSIGVNSPTGTIGATAPNCAVTPNAPSYWSATTATIAAGSPQAWKFIPPVNYAHNWTVNPTTNPALDLLNGVSVTTSSTVQSPIASTNYQVSITDPVTGCSQVFQTPVIVLPTPVPPVAVNSVQCGTQVPTAIVSCPTCTGNETFNWYTAATNGALYQGVINENFNTSTTGTLYGNAALTGARCVLTENIASQDGALLLGSTGVNSNAYNINFDFQVGPSDALGYNGADGFSYSFGDDVNATATTPAAENGSGTKLKLGFVSYTNGGSTAGIYLMYNCLVDEQTPGTPGVLAFSPTLTWKNTSTPVALTMTIDALGQVSVNLNGIAIFSNVPLPPNYLLENKSTWLTLFKARTGAGFSRHAVDNVQVQAQPAQPFTSVQQAVSNSVTYYVQTIDGLCGSTSLTPISITVNPAPAFGITSAFTACQNGSYPLTVTTGASSYTNFTWSPAALLFNDAALTSPYVAGTNATTVYFSAATVGAQPAITCSATDGGIGTLQCGASASVNIIVQANPIAPIIAAPASAVCSGATSAIEVQAGGSYCASGANYTYDEEIFNVTLGTLNNSSTCLTLAGGPGSILEKYSNYTSGPGAPAAPNIAAGATTSGSVTIGSCGNFNYTSGLAVFVDLNQDGDFIDAGEKVYSNGALANLNCVPAAAATVSLIIPATALSGLTRMRIVNQEGISGDAINPCTIQSWGETEDYLINITGGASYNYTWTPAVAGNSTAASVTTLPLTVPTTYTVVLNDGTCSSAPSNALTIGIAGTPVITTAASSPVSGYCASGALYTYDEEIFNVTLGTMNNSSTCTTLAGGPGSILERYSNYTSGAGAPAVPNLAAGSTTAGSVNIGSCGNFNYTSGLAVFIDFNQDGDFTDAGEKVFTNGAVANLNCVPATAVPISVTVPATAVGGQTRMRVVNQESISGDNITPCTVASWGETEDYLVNITGGAVNIPCPGATFNLSSTATNGGSPYTYAWTVLSGSATLSAANIANPTAVVNTDATLQLTVTDVCGSVVTSTVVANINENPITITPANSAICINSSTTLTAANGSNYTWTPTNDLSASNTAVVIANPTSTVTYTVNGTYGIGCSGSTNTTVTVNPLPVVNAGLDQTVCLNTPVVLNAAGATSYTWNNNVSNGVAFTPASTTVYTVTGTDANGCVNQDQVTISVNGLPGVSAGQDFAICNGFGATLTGNGANTYTWNNNVNNGVVFFPNTTQSYVVTGTGANGCSNQDTITITVNNTPVVSLTNGGSSCANGTVALSATTTNAYGGFWSATNGGGVLSPNVSNSNVVYNANPSDPSTVNFTYVAFNQCGSTTASTSISVLSLPTVNAGLNQTACANSNVTLTATSNGTVVWNSGLLDGVAFLAAQGTTSYIATATGANGCTNTDTVTVTGLALPNVGAGQDQTVCAGESVTLNGSGANSYAWNNNVIDGVPFPPTATGQYSVTGTGSNGCSNQDNVNVTVNALPNAIVISADPVTLVASPAGATYQWINCATGQAIADANNDTLVATSNGGYAVIVTNASGCSDTSECTIVDQVGIYFPESAFIGLYPNPTNGIVTLELPADDGAIANVFDSQGKLIMSISNAKNGEQFDLSTLSTGVYTFRVTLNNLTHIQKVVKH